MSANSCHLERRNCWPDFKKVRVVAHFPQLHEDIYHTEQVATGKSFLGP